uniref:Protein kinase domain-containing protein n=1 Tax=Setaria digitata TaxID=48799 RepID=A0A915PBY1_9BILA
MKLFNAFYDSKIFTRLSDFYISWARRSEKNHDIVRAILIKAERMKAKPEWLIGIRKKQFAAKEEKLILSDLKNSVTAPEANDTFTYPWDVQQQAKLMDDMEIPSFIKFYNVRPKHQTCWEAYIYNYVKEELTLISAIVQIYHCAMFVDKCLTVQEFTSGTLKQLIKLQNSGDVKLNELIFAIIVLDLMKVLRCIHQMNIIHGCFKSDNIFISKRIACRPELEMLRSGTTLLVKVANWDFAIRSSAGIKYGGEYINENEVVTDGDYQCGPWSYEIDRRGFLNIVNELICGRKLTYLRCKNGRCAPLLGLKRHCSMHEIWSNLFRRCLDTESFTWDELIHEFAQTTDASIRENEDEWIKSSAGYNILFLQLLKKNSQFYP